MADSLRHIYSFKLKRSTLLHHCHSNAAPRDSPVIINKEMLAAYLRHLY